MNHGCSATSDSGCLTACGGRPGRWMGHTEPVSTMSGPSLADRVLVGHPVGVGQVTGIGAATETGGQGIGQGPLRWRSGCQELGLKSTTRDSLWLSQQHPCRGPSSSVHPDQYQRDLKQCPPNPPVRAVTVRPVPDPEGKIRPVGHLRYDSLPHRHEEGIAQLRCWPSQGVIIWGGVKGQDPD